MTSQDAFDSGFRPTAVISEEQFVVALRRLRERAGLTFKEIERLTSADGSLVLPASTLATALHRRTAPRPEMVATLVRVCGGGPEDVAEWLALRERLVHPLHQPADQPTAPTASAVPDEPHPPVPPAPQRARWSPKAKRRAAGGAAVLLGLAAAATVAMTAGSQEGPGAPAPAATARVKVQAVAAERPPAGADLLKIGGLCLSERDHDRSGRVYLSACARSFPVRRLKPYGALWRITTEHPRFGPGCMGVVDGSAAAGTAMSDDTCEGVQTDRFLLRRVPGGYQFLPENHDLCVGVAGAPRTGAQLKQLACDPRAPGQRFTVNVR